MVLTIYCIACNKHEFKLDSDILSHTPFVELKCPKPDCERSTRIYLGKDGEIVVSPV